MKIIIIILLSYVKFNKIYYKENFVKNCEIKKIVRDISFIFK